MLPIMVECIKGLQDVMPGIGDMSNLQQEEYAQFKVLRD